MTRTISNFSDKVMGVFFKNREHLQVASIVLQFIVWTALATVFCSVVGAILGVSSTVVYLVLLAIFFAHYMSKQ